MLLCKRLTVTCCSTWLLASHVGGRLQWFCRLYSHARGPTS